MSPDQARALFLDHCQPGGRGTLERYGEKAAAEAIGAVTAFIEAEARRYAGMYPQASDGHNTFVIFADMIFNLTAVRVNAPKPLTGDEIAEYGRYIHGADYFDNSVEAVKQRQARFAELHNRYLKMPQIKEF